MNPLIIPAALARRLVLQAQGLSPEWQLPPRADGALEAVRRLGSVQIDSIHVVERAHHHVLWSRHRGYRPGMLNELLRDRRAVFEYWTHAASYIPMEYYRFSLPKMRAAAGRARTQERLEELSDVFALVRSRIGAEGPLGAADFDAPEGFEGGWFRRKPAKVALETLFDMGELMIHERRRFQRIYDLRERVLPAHVDTSEPSLAETHRHIVRTIIAARGLACDRDVRGWQSPKAFEATARELTHDGEIVALRMAEDNGRTYYAHPEALHRAGMSADVSVHMHILSPFDPSMIRRESLDALFGFRYRLECYVPARKRRYGYFALPILWGDRFVGRADCKADRGAGTLLARQLTMEEGVPTSHAFMASLAEALRSYAAFTGCGGVCLQRTEPVCWRELLAAYLDIGISCP